MSPAPALHDLASVVHLHSLYSDGTGTVAEIAAAAGANGLDVVLLTDHDTLEARDRGEEGHHDGVLVLVGEEVSPPGRNHYLAFGVDRVVDHRDLTAEGICTAVSSAGGFGFAAHPFSRGSTRFRRARGMPWDDLDCEGLDGIELWSWVTDTAERLPNLRTILRFIVTPSRVVDHPPESNLAAWDELCRRRRVVALGGLDAHQFGLRMGRVVLRLMSYRRSFRHLRTHVLAHEPLSGNLEHDRDQVYGALREGRCYLAVDSLAPARGFNFWAERAREALPMGTESQAGSWTLRAVTPRPALLRLLCNGDVIATTRAPTLGRSVQEPGVYRVEARLTTHGSERTWIVSNPVYLR